METIAINGNGNHFYEISDAPKEDKIILRPLTHMSPASSRNIIQDLCRGYNYWLNVPEKERRIIEDVTILLVDSSSLTDDLQFDVESRNGILCAHREFGIPNTITAAVFGISCGLHNCFELDNMQIYRIYSNHSANNRRSQGMSLDWRETFRCPSEDEYFEMVYKKTQAELMSVKMMEVYNIGERKDFTKLNELIGLFIHLREVCLNFHPRGFPEDVYICDEISQGRYTLPVIHALQNNPEDDRFLAIIRQRSNADVIKKYSATLLDGFGSYDYTKGKLREIRDQILDEIRKLGGNFPFEKIIGKWCKDVI